MDDGFSGVTGYALGRMSAQRERSLQDFGKALQRRFRPAAPTVDVNALIAENEMLRQQLVTTQAHLSDLLGIYSRLDVWATEAARALHEHGLIQS